MPQFHYGKKGEPASWLQLSPDLLVVRTRSRLPLRGGPVMPPGAAQVADSQLVAEFPEAGVEVYKVVPDKRSVDARKLALRSAPDVRFAGSGLTDTAGEPVVYTENLFVKFRDEEESAACRQVLHELDLTIKEELTYANNAFFVAAPEGTGQAVFDLAEQLHRRDDVEYAHPELVKKRARKTIFEPQWHLKPTRINNRDVVAHANVHAAHTITRGEGVTIAIIDDGVDIDHPEFRSAAKVVFPRDVSFPADRAQGLDPRPRGKDSNHGTACAGVACASGLEGASGVAPAAKLLPIRLAAGLGSQQEANAFVWAADHGADVISCSWGPMDGRWFDPDDELHTHIEPLPASTKLAIDYAVTRGRAGKGCVVLFAAGNGNESADNDGYASYEKVIAVAACNDRSKRSAYSDFGRAVWCAFPSSDFGVPEESRPEPLTPGIWTTDRVSRLGYNEGLLAEGDAAGNYTNSFGGTSSACPGAAGVVALMLSAHPSLTAPAVKELLKRACDRVDTAGGAYEVDGHSRFYGYGRLNAERAVNLVHEEAREALLVSKVFNRKIADLQTIEASLDVAEPEPLRALAILVDIRHTYIGDLTITLIAPAAAGAAPVILHQRVGGSSRDLRRTFDLNTTPALSQFGGRSAQGRWTLRIADTEREDEGTLVSFGLELRFQAAAPRIAAE